MVKLMIPSVKEKNVENAELNRVEIKKILCFTNRQWALLTAILMFIITAVCAFCFMLGAMHTHKLQTILKNDLLSEGDKRQNAELNESESKIASYIMNQKKLTESFIKVADNLGTVSWYTMVTVINLCFNAFMIYGIVTTNRWAIAPWLYVTVGTGALVGSYRIYNYVETEEYSSIWYLVLIGFVISPMWSIIYNYYKKIVLADQKFDNLRPVIVQAHGGYTHTVQITHELTKKFPPLTSNTEN